MNAYFNGLQQSYFLEGFQIEKPKNITFSQGQVVIMQLFYLSSLFLV